MPPGAHALALDAPGYALHNVAELLPGGTRDVFPAADLARLTAQADRKGKTDAFAAFTAAQPHGVWLSRVPTAVRRALNHQASLGALRGAGVELRCVLTSDDAVTFQLDAPAGRAPLEVWWGDHFGQLLWLEPAPTTLRLTPPPRLAELTTISRRHPSPWSPAVLRLVMPFGGFVRLQHVGGAMRRPRADETPSRTLLIYGSSITMGGNAVLSCDTYARVLARRLGVDLRNLGGDGRGAMPPGGGDCGKSRASGAPPRDSASARRST